MNSPGFALLMIGLGVGWLTLLTMIDPSTQRDLGMTVTGTHQPRFSIIDRQQTLPEPARLADSSNYSSYNSGTNSIDKVYYFFDPNTGRLVEVAQQ